MAAPLLADDIPVLREVWGDGAFYFTDDRDSLPAILKSLGRDYELLHEALDLAPSGGLSSTPAERMADSVPPSLSSQSLQER